MVWESGCTVIVMLTPLVEDGVKQCDRYWPDEGSSLYHVYEVSKTPKARGQWELRKWVENLCMYEYKHTYAHTFTHTCTSTYMCLV